MIRYFQMPTIPKRERRMAVAFEAKKYLPFKLEELITDFQIVIHRSDPTLMRVMFFGIKKNSVNAVLSILESVDLTPLCLETAPVSLMRLLRQTGQFPAGQVAAILMAERDTATITIARDDLLYLSRNVTILSSLESEQGTSTELLEALINETRISIDYYRRRFLGEPGVGKVILFGKNIEEKRVQELTAALDLPVEIGDAFQKIEGGKEVPPGLAIATGLALRGLEKKAWEPNLLPPEYQRKLQGLLQPAILEAIAAMALLGIWYGYSFVDLYAFQQKIDALRMAQMHPRGLQPGMRIPDLKSLGEEQQRQTQFLDELSKTRGQYAALLTELTRLLPEEAWLQNAVLEDKVKASDKGPLLASNRSQSMKLSGGSYVNNRDRELEGINNFLAALRSNKTFNSTFSEFYLDGVNRGRYREEEVTQFRLTCVSNPDRKGNR